MAGGSGGRFYNSTCGASVTDTVLMTDAGFSVRISNVTGSAPIYATVDHPGGKLNAPTIGGNGVVIPAAVGSAISVRHAAQYGSVVQIISASAQQYSIEVQGNHATS